MKNQEYYKEKIKHYTELLRFIILSLFTAITGTVTYIINVNEYHIKQFIVLSVAVPVIISLFLFSRYINMEISSLIEKLRENK
jgi:hypothetical protein